jgi:DNA-binding NtrC family response regulator
MQSAPSISTPVKILVVEGDNDLREALAIVLAAAGFAVRQAANSKDAIAHLVGSDLLPSLIVLDMNMPIMDSTELHSIVRSYARLCKLPILVIFGESGRLAPAILSDPKVSYLTEPLGTPTLLKAVERCLGHAST